MILVIIMTVQFTIVNLRRHIFASDDGLTTPMDKKYEGMQKIYKLSDIHPAQMMINGNMEFENIPMETIINEFIRNTDFEKLKTIEEIKNKFIDFLAKYCPTSSCDEYIEFVADKFKEDLKVEIVENSFDNVIETRRKRRTYPFIKKYSSFNDEFEDMIPENKDKEKYTELLWQMFSWNLKYEGTGVIISGHNINSPYPSYFEINAHCNDPDGIIYEELESKIDFEDTLIRIYAINEEGYAFFTGVHDEFIDFISKYINETNEVIVHRLKSKLKEEKINTHDKIIEIVENTITTEYSDVNDEIINFKSKGICETSKSIEFIPNHLLCILADEIIRLTAMKQKISSEDEYVSMNSHISLMTKANGFKWIKFNNEII